jgi:hypothetical protein
MKAHLLRRHRLLKVIHHRLQIAMLVLALRSRLRYFGIRRNVHCVFLADYGVVAGDLFDAFESYVDLVGFGVDVDEDEAVFGDLEGVVREALFGVE